MQRGALERPSVAEVIGALALLALAALLVAIAVLVAAG
jgi:hypothetical protein